MPNPSPSSSLAQSTGIRVAVVRIANFRSLCNIEVELGDVTVLVGMNNSGKTSFLRALHLALGADRRLISPDDFYVDHKGQEADRILIDVLIVPRNSDGSRADRFEQTWIDGDFGGGIVSFGSDSKEFVAYRTQVTHDLVKNEVKLERLVMVKWPERLEWQKFVPGSKTARFDQITSYLIDAQRDIVGDLRSRSSYMGRMLSNIHVPESAVKDLERRLAELNADMVANSDVLLHLHDRLVTLNQTLPSSGAGVELTPVSPKIRDITKSLGMQFSDSEGSSFPLESHGMGTRSWASLLTFDAYVSWAARLAQDGGHPFHPVLSLEEPEAHLHPNAQRQVYMQLSKGIGQRIVSTHSPFVAGQCAFGDLAHFRKIGQETQVQRINLNNLDPDEQRKVRREVLRSRGELLFSRAVVLFEGETEELSLPLFAESHWNKNPFELGLAFASVGGEANYAPFIRVFEALGVPWFIFNDGEPNAVKRVSQALSIVGHSYPHAQVTMVPNDKNIERHLIEAGYQAEMKLAVIESEKPFPDLLNEQARTAEIHTWDDSKLARHYKSKKTRLAAHWAKAIIALGGARSIPAPIRNLFASIDNIVGLGKRGAHP